MTYNECNGLVATVRDPNDLAAGRVGTQYHRDLLNEIWDVDYPDGGEVTTSYGFGWAPEYDGSHADNPPTFVRYTQTVANADADDPGEFVVLRTAYDGAGRQVATLTADGLASQVTYDPNGRISVAYEGTASTSYQYDALSRAVKEVLADGSIRWTCYRNLQTANQPNCHPNVAQTSGTTAWIDQTDWSASGTVGPNRQTSTNSLGKLISAVEPPTVPLAANGSIVTYGYDALGNLNLVSDWC